MLSLRIQCVKLTFFSGSHLAPKYFKVVANFKKVGGHYVYNDKKHFYPVMVIACVTSGIFFDFTKKILDVTQAVMVIDQGFQ